MEWVRMVKKKDLVKRIEDLEKTVEVLSNGYKPFFNAVIALNKKVVKILTKEGVNKTEIEKVSEWLKDDRIEEIQDYLNKGAKK